MALPVYSVDAWLGETRQLVWEVLRWMPGGQLRLFLTVHGAITQLIHWLLGGHMLPDYWGEPVAILAMPLPITHFRPIAAKHERIEAD